MYQRSKIMETPSENQAPSQNRGRTNSKLKVLGRSDAMREETSPPPEPIQSFCTSPSVKLSPSSKSSPTPLLVLSPSISRGNSPCRASSLGSPTSTLVPSPKCRSSPPSISPNFLEHADGVKLQVCTQMSNRDNGCSDRLRCYHEVSKHSCHDAESTCSCKCDNNETSSQSKSSSCRRSFKNERATCDCPKPTCTKCMTNHFNNNNLSVHKSVRNKLRHQSSSQGSFEGSISNSPCLSRVSSTELQYTDASGTHLEHFIAETVNKNPKDRAFMLRIETELVSLANDSTRNNIKFPPMTSYQRMCIHRVAAHFGMEHNIDGSAKCVVVSKTPATRIPETPFSRYIKDELDFIEEPQRSILKRENNSLDDYNFKSPDRHSGLENRRSKSFEEREEEYLKVKRRIFNKEMQDFSSAEEFGWSEVPWSSTDSDASSRFRLLHPERHTGRLLKVQSVETRGDMPRPCVAKSYSFGGYGGVSVLTRGDSVLSTHSAGPRLLTKQDSGASNVSWRLSPSSSGYKSQSLISESITPSPTSTPNPSGESIRQDSVNSSICISTSEPSTPALEKDTNETQLMWAVSDIHNVPKGSVIINPQTGEAVKNVDGSLYHYDPSNPPDLNGSSTSLNSNSERSPPVTKSFAPEKLSKEQISSPKKLRPKLSSSSSSLNKRSNFTNSSTSPSLPFTPPPPLQSNRTIQFSTSESVPNLPVQQQYHPVYGNNFNNLPPPPAENTLPMYQPPCVVYASYAPYDGRIDPPMQEVGSGGYFMPDPPGTPTPQGYQPGFWNHQPMLVYQNPPPSNAQVAGPPPPPQAQRFAVPVPSPAGPYIPPYANNYGHTSQSMPNLPHASSQNAELIPMYSHQPVQVLYPTSNQPNTMMYSNPGVVYQNSVYPSMMVPVQNLPQSVPYPQNPPTPSSCPPFNVYCGQMQEQQSSFGHLTHNMSQLSIGTNPTNSNQALAFNHNMSLGLSQPDPRSQRNTTPKGHKFNNPRNMVSGSSQSSTGTNSPATTVIAGFCNQNVAQYRTSPETSPTQNVAYGYPPNFMAPVVFKPIGNVRVNTPVSRNSRSPTPNDTQQMDRHRFSLPPTLFQGMPYVLPNDSRTLPIRSQPNMYRQQQPSVSRQQSTNANKKKPRNKITGLPPSGK